MSLELPSDLTRLAPSDVNPYQSAGVYVLELEKPSNPTRAWDAEYDTRPEWFEEFRDSERVLYCGAAQCVLSRLEDHRNADVRKTVLTRVCDVQSLEQVWWYDNADTAFLKESQHALQVDQETSDRTFVRSA